jgi:hypothetical protein
LVLFLFVFPPDFFPFLFHVSRFPTFSEVADSSFVLLRAAKAKIVSMVNRGKD